LARSATSPSPTSTSWTTWSDAVREHGRRHGTDLAALPLREVAQVLVEEQHLFSGVSSTQRS
jgi:hypothetical protein